MPDRMLHSSPACGNGERRCMDPVSATSPSTAATSHRGVVAAGHADEVAAGLAILESGGNAIDALVAAAFTGYVVEPTMCGIGGYGRLAAFVAGSGEMISVDHYVRAPAAARPDMFEIDDTRGL